MKTTEILLILGGVTILVLLMRSRTVAVQPATTVVAAPVAATSQGNFLSSIGSSIGSQAGGLLGDVGSLFG